MFRFFISLLVVIPVLAQSTLTLSGPANIRPGQNATVTLTLTAPGAKPAGLQWTATIPAAVGGPGTAAIGASATAAGKTLYRSTDGAVHLLVGLNANTMATGEVARYTLTVPAGAAKGLYQIPLSGLIAADTVGDVQPLTSGAAYSIRVLSRADINGDGQTTMIDVQAIIDQVLGRAACTDDQNGDTRCDLIDVLTVIREAIQ